MTSYRIRYQGPSSFALNAARTLAEADGIRLTSSAPPERHDGDVVSLLLTVEATSDALQDALASVAADLPPDATMAIDA